MAFMLPSLIVPAILAGGFIHVMTDDGDDDDEAKLYGRSVLPVSSNGGGNTAYDGIVIHGKVTDGKQWHHLDTPATVQIDNNARPQLTLGKLDLGTGVTSWLDEKGRFAGYVTGLWTTTSVSSQALNTRDSEAAMAEAEILIPGPNEMWMPNGTISGLNAAGAPFWGTWKLERKLV